MFTVMRFVAPDGIGEGDINRLGAELNSLVAGAFERPDKVGGRFSVTVADGGRWAEHDAKLLSFVDEARAAIRSAAVSGYTLQCDVLLEPEDLMGVVYLSVDLSPELMRCFVTEQISVTFTVVGHAG